MIWRQRKQRSKPQAVVGCSMRGPHKEEFLDQEALDEESMDEKFLREAFLDQSLLQWPISNIVHL